MEWFLIGGIAYALLIWFVSRLFSVIKEYQKDPEIEARLAYIDEEGVMRLVEKDGQNFPIGIAAEPAEKDQNVKVRIQ